MNQPANRALRAFLGDLVDYAGLFPPASLTVEKAVAEYAAHRQESESWMLGRFIAPAKRLEEICAAAAALGVAESWEYSLLVGDGSGTDEAMEAIPAQGKTAQDCESRFPARIAALETPLPKEGAGARTTVFGPLLLEALDQAGLGGRELYLEVPAGVDDSASIQAIRALAETESFSKVGAKLRCGGVRPEAFPTVERVVEFILACRNVHLPLKCTAGLHHPVRHRAVEPDVMMHGFLNVFGAGVLAYGGLLDRATLVDCVAETDPSAFGFADGGFHWRDHHASAEIVADARRDFLGGFGSCSFVEPRADLKNLEIL